MDVQKFITSCDRFQLAKPARNSNKALLQPIYTSGPIEVWASDIMGPLPYASSGRRYILVAIDLFTRWIEVVPFVDQTAVFVAKALVESVILRHEIPRALLTDQDPNFESHQ